MAEVAVVHASDDGVALANMISGPVGEGTVLRRGLHRLELVDAEVQEVGVAVLVSADDDAWFGWAQPADLRDAHEVSKVQGDGVDRGFGGHVAPGTIPAFLG